MVLDREEAIREAVLPPARDMLVIAGKGHENRQIFRDRAVPFDDREVAAAALRGRAQGLKERQMAEFTVDEILAATGEAFAVIRDPRHRRGDRQQTIRRGRSFRPAREV